MARVVRLTGVAPREAVTVAVQRPGERPRVQVADRARVVPVSRQRPRVALRTPRLVAVIVNRLAPAGTRNVVVTDRPRRVQRADRRPTVGVDGVGTAAGTVMPSLVAVGIAGRLQHHVELPAGRWAALLVLMWVGTVPFALLGLAIGYGLTPQLAQPVNFLAFLTLSVLGGLLVPAAYFPDLLRHLAHTLPT